jgi:hypothetical protein
MNRIELELVKGSNKTWNEIRAKHYIADNGNVGRQLRYLIHYDAAPDGIAGIIAGGMSSLAGESRDQFFGLDIARRFDDYFAEEQQELTPMRITIRNACVINNTVFRLTYHEHGLASRVLACWREQVTDDWTKYDNSVEGTNPLGETIDLPILGFETYIVPHNHGNGKRRERGML